MGFSSLSELAVHGMTSTAGLGRAGMDGPKSQAGVDGMKSQAGVDGPKSQAGVATSAHCRSAEDGVQSRDVIPTRCGFQHCTSQAAKTGAECPCHPLLLGAALTFTVVLLMGCAVWAVCGGSLHGGTDSDALLMCPVTEDAAQISGSFVISYALNQDFMPETVLDCDSLADGGDDSLECRSGQGFTLVALQRHFLVVKVPQSLLHQEGSYSLQLLSQEYRGRPLTKCLTLVPSKDEARDTPKRISPLVPFAASDLPQAPDLPQKVSADAGDGGHRVFVAIVAVSVCFIILLIAGIVLHERRIRKRTSKQEPSQDIEQQVSAALA